MKALRVDSARPASLARHVELHASCPAAFIQQSAAWARAIAPLGPDEPVFLLAEHEGVDVAGLPLYLYRHALGNILSSVPQAGPLGGVFCRPGLTDAQRKAAYESLLAEALRLAREEDCLSFSCITNPLQDDRQLYQTSMAPDLSFENFTQVVELATVFSGGELRLADGKRRNHHARNLRKAAAAGIALSSCRSAEDWSDWLAVHRLRHGELGLVPLPELLLQNLRTELKQGRSELLLATHSGRVVGGVFLVRHRDVMDVFMLSVGREAAAHGAAWLLVDGALHLARESGVRWLNWQSSPSRDSGVYQFKKQWGAVERPYAFVTKLFQGLERLRDIGESALREAYAGHYVLPYSSLRPGGAVAVHGKG